MYSQDLSNCTTQQDLRRIVFVFLYSQDLSNCTTLTLHHDQAYLFLYSQDLSNCTTGIPGIPEERGFCTLKI